MKSRVATLASVGCLSISSPLFAASLAWEPDGSSGLPSGGTGTWDTSSSLWDDGGVITAWNNATPDAAVFGGTAGTVTLAESITAGILTFETAGYTLLGSGIDGHTLTTAGIILNANATLGDSSTARNPVLRLGGDISGTGTLSSLAAWLSSDSDTARQITSPLLLGAGDGARALRLGDPARPGTLTFTGPITTNGSGRGVEVMAGSTAVFPNGVTQAAAGHSISKTGPGTLILGGSSTFTGNLNLGNGILEMAANGRLYNTGFNNSAVITISGGATWRIPNYSYAGMGQLADYRQRRVLDNGTIEVTANSHSSGQDFTVNAGGGTFRYTPVGQTLTLSGNANTNTQFNGPLTFDTLGNISVTGTSAVLEGSGSLLKTGPATLTLGNAGNSFTGNLTAQDGLLRATALTGSTTTSSLGAKSATRTIAVDAPAAMEWTSNNILGGSGLNASSLPTIRLTGSTFTTTRFNVVGNLILDGASLINANNTDPETYHGFQFIGSLTANGTSPSSLSTTTGRSNHLRGGSATPVQVTDPAGRLTISTTLRDGSGDSPGTGSLIKTGPGTLSLTATNLYSGPTTIAEGTLDLGGSLAGNLTIQPGAVLDLTSQTGLWSPAANRSLSAGRPENPATDVIGDLLIGPSTTLLPGNQGSAATLTLQGDLVLDGGTILFDLGPSPAASDAIRVDGEFIIDDLPGTTLSFLFLQGTVNAGVYPLITTTGGVIGDLANISLNGLPNGPGGRQNFTLSTTTLPNTLTLDVTGTGAMLVWNNASGSGLWNDTDANWNNNGSNDSFLPADIVRLEDTANAVETLTLAGNLEPASVTAANSPATTYRLEGTGSLAGSGGLVANGGGALILRNSNSFEGPLAISNGSLVRLENPAALRPDGLITIDNATFEISSSETVVVGTVNLGPDSEITGDGGALDALSINASGGSIRTNLTGGGELAVTSGASVSLASSSNRTGATTISPGGTLRLLDGSALSGNINLSGILACDAGSGSSSLNATLSGSGGLRVDSGSLTLAGAQSYGGATTVNSGLLDLASADGRLYANTYYGGPVLTVQSGATLRAARINYGAGNHLGQLTHNSPNNVLNGGTLELSGASDASGRGWTITAAGGTIRSAAASSQTWSPNNEAWTQIDLNNNATLTFDVGGVFTLRSTLMDYTGVPGGPGGIATSSGGLAKTGPGLLELGPLTLTAAANTHRYSGTTQVQQGTLLLNANLGSSPIEVATGATLAIGTASPSYSCGGLGISNGATLSIPIDSAGPSASRLDVAGNVSLGGASLEIADLSAAPLPAGTKITLLSHTGELTGTFAGLPEGASLPVGQNSFTISYQDGNAVTLTATPATTQSYALWAAQNAPTGGPADDFDNDSVANAIEWVLGGSATSNDSTKLPSATTTENQFVFSFLRAKDSRSPDTSVRIQVGTSLSEWPLSFEVGSSPEITVTSENENQERVTLTLPRGSDLKRFARLEVLIQP